MDRRYKCYECELQYSKASNLKRHFTSKHPKMKYNIRKHSIKRKWGVTSPLLDFSEDTPSSVVLAKEHTRQPDALFKENNINYNLPILLCPYCPWKTNSDELFTKHLLWHFKPYQCHLCRYCSLSESKFGTHIYMEHGKPWYCEVCNYLATDEEELLLHIRDIQHEKFPCSDCHLVFDVEWKLRMHVIQYHTKVKLIPKISEPCLMFHYKQYKGNKTFVCTLCEFKTNRISLLKGHLKRKFNYFPCNFCNREYKNRTYLQEHLNRIHQRIICVYCPFIGSADEVKQHHENEHIGEIQPLKCTKCAWVCSTIVELKVHDVINHQKIMLIENSNQPIFYSEKAKGRYEYTCSYCKWSGTFREEYKKHLNLHIRAFECDICEYRANRRILLVRHASQRHGKLLCITCFGSYDDEKCLQDHQKLAHGNPLRSMKLYCASCYDGFETRAEFEMHAILKHERRLKECLKCDFRTTCRNILSDHKKKCITPVKDKHEVLKNMLYFPSE